MENLRDRNGKPPLTKEEMARFRELFPLDYLSRVALAAWVNVRPDQLPKEMQAHNCPATMEAWARVAEAIRTALASREAPPACQQEAVTVVEIERLTKDRDEATIKAECWETAARKMEDDRDEARSMLADAERDMRQRAAELIPPGNLRSEVLALPLHQENQK